jgi:phosphopantothenoylcysteine decarboxylase/phosphopantothenate--cysteine ligase
MNLKNKKILITAGPTWVPIDSVRVISNIATGETGILLAERLLGLGAAVTLLLGPFPNGAFLRRVSSGSRRDTKAKTTFGTEACCLNRKIKLLRFKFFEDLKNIIKRELSSKKYDIVIHSAAVSDYRPLRNYIQKIKSDKKIWSLDLVPTAKIIDLIRKIDRSLFVVGFKFELQVTKSILFERTKELIERANLDLAVANTIDKSKYRAYIINNNNQIHGPVLNKKDLVVKLISFIRGNLCKN